jgi:hypothetical protein
VAVAAMTAAAAIFRANFNLYLLVKPNQNRIKTLYERTSDCSPSTQGMPVRGRPQRAVSIAHATARHPNCYPRVDRCYQRVEMAERTFMKTPQGRFIWQVVGVLATYDS